MTITELKLIGHREAELYKEGLISIYRDYDKKTLVKVLLTEEAFNKLSEGKEITKEDYNKDYDELSFVEDNVTFFTLVDADE